jgi:hypothetical protein
VQETAKQIASMHAALAILADAGPSGGWVRCRKPKRPVRTMPVVVLGVESQDPLKVSPPSNQEPVQAFFAHVLQGLLPYRCNSAR